ncbi:MAG TPA: glutamyl-tRNA reductase [Vicinamibacterales bacterium]|nr:glutamyl-tRNA reductase [Vicinamibacterales bacterium]
MSQVLEADTATTTTRGGAAMEPTVIQVGVDRRHAGIDRLAELHAARRGDVTAVPLPAGAAAVALATCHRLELYLEGTSVEEAVAAFRGWFTGSAAAAPPTCRAGASAGRHLMRVTAGLESAVLGEDQILTQVRLAYRAACTAGSSGPLLHRLFHAAFRTGRRVRGETALAGGTRSLAGAAVAMLHRTLGGLRGRTVLVLGAGEMAGLAARGAAGRGVGRLIVANRSAERGAALAAAVGGEAAPWEWRSGLLSTVDGVISAVRADAPVMDAASLRRAVASGRRLVIADLGVPRNVEPVAVPGIDRFDVESLADVVHEEGQRRAEAVCAAESVVEQELEGWLAWSGSRQSFRRQHCVSR